mmetsp:Transcript_142614/g.397373  ORF Transcript_142614/g.397373 Transcript_142614/m.397373 type:complete len:348 (-) Transcript_142614:105-1148(-)
MAAAASMRRAAMTATGIGAAAGCLGTWFEMSHGVVCIPVVTLPPLALSQHVAIGSTVFGVAARQVISATLYALEPGADAAALHELVDLNACGVLAASGTLAALSSAVLSARVAPKPLRKTTGIFCVAMALFLQWRESWVKPLQNDEEEEEPEAGVLPMPAPEPVAAPKPVDAAESSSNSTSELMRYLAFGLGSGAILGFFGIGPAWMLAPALARTSPEGRRAAGQQSFLAAPGADSLMGTAFGGGALAARAEPPARAESLGPPGTDERLRRTCCLAMVPPSIAAAVRHMQLGHVTNYRQVALPLATGAIAGSVLGGLQLADVPCEDEVKYGLSLLLFAYGCWSVVKA